jgi:hypothetical protein
MKNKKLYLISLLVSLLLAGCKFGNQNEPWNNSGEALSGVTQIAEEEGVGMIDFIKKHFDGKSITTSNKNVMLFSYEQKKNSIVAPIIFLKDEPVDNMRDFIDVVNECSQQIFTKPKLDYKKVAIFLGFSSDGKAVCGFSMYPTEQVFSLKGFDFLSQDNSKYSDALDFLVKEKTGKNTISEWDYFIFRSIGKPEVAEFTPGCERTLIFVAGTTIMSLYKFEDNDLKNLIISNRGAAESIFSSVAENQESKLILNSGFSINTIWFDNRGKRIMAELARKLPNGEINRERKWYNDYKMPQ